MSIRFQADNDLKGLMVTATLRREPAIDFRTAQAADLDHLDDQAVLKPGSSPGSLRKATPALGSWS